MALAQANRVAVLQWKGDTGCVRSAHQPCEIYDAQKAAAALGDPVDDSFFGHLCSSAATLFGPEEVIGDSCN